MASVSFRHAIGGARSFRISLRDGRTPYARSYDRDVRCQMSNTYNVPTGNLWRKQARNRVLDRVSDGGVIYMEGGIQQTRNGADGLSPFRQEANFLYMTGIPDPDYACTLDTDTGKFTLFVPELPEGMEVWVGAQPSLDDIAQRFGADECLPKRHMAEAMSATSQSKLYTLSGVKVPKGAKVGIVNADQLKSVMAECRAVKLPEEVACLKHANDISGAAHEAMWRACTPGVYEYQLEAVFLNHTMSAGLRHQGYPAIVGAGKNSATLHYEHNNKLVKDGDLVLVDAGAEYLGYTADITRTFPASGRFSAAQKDLYEAVLKIQEASLKNLKAGLKWESVSWDASRIASECLLDLGVVKGSVDSLMEAKIASLFFPHGLGHHLGLQVHDHSPNGPAPTILKEGNVVTCEPGLYFVDSILGQALNNTEKKHFLVEDALSSWKHIGGVRIEDDVLIQSDGIENLTTASKQIADVEAIMQQV